MSPGRGASFATFAEHRVRGAMLDELRRLDHLPRRLRNRTDDLVKTRKKLAGSLGREATVEEVATDLGVEVEEASDMAALLEPPLPLDSILPTLAGGEATDATVLRAEAVGRLTDAIEKLPERLRLVLSLHYIEDLTYREIAGILKVSEPRVCQLHSEAIGRTQLPQVPPRQKEMIRRSMVCDTLAAEVDMRARSLILSVAFASGLAQGCASPPKAVQGNAGQGGNSGTGGATSSSACPAYVSYSSDAGALAAGHLGSGPLEFSSCPLLSNPAGQVPAIVSAMADCATAKAPVDWNNPTGDTIDVFVKRYAAAQQPAKGQLWLLMGGPGGAGSNFERWVYDLAKSLPTLDIYMPDHRGTGMSSFASCATTPNNLSPTLTAAQAATCAACIPHLDGLTVTGAAQDLAHIIDATREPSQQVFVYGMSYGTYWAQRYMEIRPDQPTAVVLDSTVPANGIDFSMQDKQFDDAAHAVLDLCQADATCSAKLGPDPVATGHQAVDALWSGACNPWPEYDMGLANFLAGGMLPPGKGPYFDRILLPASIYRILRCNSADLAWFGQVHTHMMNYGGYGASDGFADATCYNVEFSEFWPSNPSPADLKAQEPTLIAFTGMVSDATIASSWPRYPTDSYYGTWPTSSAPTLVMQGTLDPLTPFGDIVKTHYSGANQYFVEFPNATHVVVGASPMVDPNAQNCGIQVLLSFLTDSTKAPDTSCVAGMAPLDFSNPPADWMATVGITDLWEN
jgi:RNA polymerase sigma factor (sigma-70 family)